MYPTISVFGREFGTYGICAALGLMVCGFVLSFIAKRKNISYLDVILAILSIGIGLTIGGHLLYGITRYEYVLATIQMIGTWSFKEILAGFSLAFGGSVFYGGFLGGIAGLAAFLKIEKGLNKADFFDLYGLGIPLFHTFGRIGCFLGGCCYGVECEIGFLVEHNDYSPGLAGVRRFPIQLVEAGLNLCLFFVLYFIYRRINRTVPLDDSGSSKGGLIFFLYMLIYPVYRFILEFFRGDEIRRTWGFLTTSQWMSILIFISGLIGTIVILRRGRLSSD